jgi:hypothetical protein
MIYDDRVPHLHSAIRDFVDHELGATQFDDGVATRSVPIGRLPIRSVVEPLRRWRRCPIAIRDHDDVIADRASTRPSSRLFDELQVVAIAMSERIIPASIKLHIVRFIAEYLRLRVSVSSYHCSASR